MPVSMLTMNNMIKKKYLPFYEDQQLNFYIRSRSSPEKVKEFYTESAVLRPVMHSGNLWNTIKNLFKKGKDFTKKTMDFIDNTPILKDLKDVGFDMIKEKTGVDPNVYYDTAKNVINKITPTKPKQRNDQQQLYKPTIQPQNQYYNQQQNYDYGQQLKNYYQDIVQSPMLPPVYKPQVEQNYKAFSLGSELAGGNQTIMRNLPKLLLISKSSRGGYTIKKDFKPLLNKFGIKTLTLPKTLKDFIDKMNKSNGRLYLGNGKCGESGPLTIAQNEFAPIQQPRSNGKNKIDRYNEILNKLKK